ncbi:hypothetical protein DICSQDRAFT_166086 [Dichomitus squalens LYAD-421 SS1]|uniref:uncharacterized protein n=1 Tax=Dichomitus squalens (strain LYAD-421) TaxID=732165 RepID=UPI00044146C7|nr:uncharacterized protein DICSQDRAFT_166086 [Dichomitus squalens LYAD-421 SS1]EJF65026.1 hypothetical protein DICSQDRAFT_166086 [Dichomitus squalens LYAD-421 SS1]
MATTRKNSPGISPPGVGVGDGLDNNGGGGRPCNDLHDVISLAVVVIAVFYVPSAYAARCGRTIPSSVLRDARGSGAELEKRPSWYLDRCCRGRVQEDGYHDGRRPVGSALPLHPTLPGDVFTQATRSTRSRSEPWDIEMRTHNCRPSHENARDRERTSSVDASRSSFSPIAIQSQMRRRQLRQPAPSKTV